MPAPRKPKGYDAKDKNSSYPRKSMSPSKSSSTKKSPRATEGSKGYNKPAGKVSPRAAEGGKGYTAPPKPKKPKGGFGSWTNNKKMPQANVYSVKKGDSLWAIAQKKGTTVAKLMQLNPQLRKRANSNTVVLYSGTKVRVPGVGGGTKSYKLK
jgi:LysM repeat protein